MSQHAMLACRLQTLRFGALELVPDLLLALSGGSVLNDVAQMAYALKFVF